MAGQANLRQEGGTHYSAHGTKDLQHWDVVRIFDLGYLIGNATKYLFRWRSKNGIEDLKKAIHYIEKQIEEASLPSAVTDCDFERIEMRVAAALVEQTLAQCTDAQLSAELARRGAEREAANMQGHASRVADSASAARGVEQAGGPYRPGNQRAVSTPAGAPK